MLMCFFKLPAKSNDVVDVVVRDGNEFGVNMNYNQKVEKIREKKPSVMKCDAGQLMLYIANKELAHIG
ncbi:uncharacterized protein PHALS_15476 [Plasmopara halstedii]|uniref:Uncharacterized protein n=1 Tax=Plasmopara halstedii TaxID=4781 RepID=A0A0P1AJC7_PLAHL|nr:uncharacterized protein PHALS_15476 [Plasmopara halstedii]CEG40910.1 hypothetical protein PHALS_15476 [Plasmopara halstedii]|eukprot:XP_024577279.1 hypothetical protein PHALS_15476 [Plasmopara halstedii]